MSQFKVITCLSCGNRQLFELEYVGAIGKFKRHLERGCPCGKNDAVVASFTYFATAKKLLETPLRKEFILIHRALQSKLKVIELMKEMVDTLSAQVAKAELANDVTPLKSVAEWLHSMVMSDVNQLKQPIKEETNGDASVPDVQVSEV